jgi:hypothetical protein
MHGSVGGYDVPKKHVNNGIEGLMPAELATMHCPIQSRETVPLNLCYFFVTGALPRPHALRAAHKKEEKERKVDYKLLKQQLMASF